MIFQPVVYDNPPVVKLLPKWINKYFLSFQYDGQKQYCYFHLYFFLKFIKKIFFWQHCATCWILVSLLGTKFVPPAVEVQNLNHWTIRVAPKLYFLDS